MNKSIEEIIAEILKSMVRETSYPNIQEFYNEFNEKLKLALNIPIVSGSYELDAIRHYDNLIKTELPRTFKELNDHGTHAEFCDKINVVREKAKDNYR